MTEQAEVCGQWKVRVRGKARDVSGVHYGVLLPTEQALHEIPDIELRGARLFDHADRDAPHHVTQRHRGQVGSGRCPHPVRRVE